MISLERRDASKELGLGFGSGREMEDIELEEGEACSYHNNINDDDDYDASVDPDIALSYIDDKLQDVLGHLQKDFEGGVSAENLGAKFGGYGSFLPAYQRSPVWSQLRTPPKVQHHNAARSPNLHLEGGCHSSVSSLNVPQSAKLEPASNNAVLLPASKASSSMIDSVKQEVCAPLICSTEEQPQRSKSVNRKSANLPDQKMLKFRIKVGSDSLSTRNNAAIYSGLGLDVSPSSSLDDSESEAISHEPQDAFIESPSHILQIMISFPVHGGQMLSPLPDDLIHFPEKEKIPKEGRSLLSGIVVNGSDSVKGSKKMLGEKKVKPLQRNEILAEPKSEINEEFWSCGNGILLKETDVDTLACDELVSNALKLPILSNSYPTVSETKKGTDRTSCTSKEVHKGVVKDKGFSNLIKEESLMPLLIPGDGWIENSTATSAGKVQEDKKASSVNSGSIHPRKDRHHKEEKPSELVKIDSNVPKGRKTVIAEANDIAKQKINEKATSHDQQGMTLLLGKDFSSSEGKKKPKGSQSHDTTIAEVRKESLGIGSSVGPKNKKSTKAGGHVIKGELEDFKLQENTGKTGDMYRDFFGDVDLEQEETRMSPSGTSCEDRLKNTDVPDKNTHGTSKMLKNKSIQKRIDKVSTYEAHPKAASVAAPGPGPGPGPASYAGNGPVSDAAPAATAPIMIEENWVQCDKCQTWRLLPLGKNPNDLPEKWLCSMLDWLPGMNRCSFSEEETTNALMAYYQVPSQSQSNIFSNAGGIPSKSILADAQHPGKNQQNFGLHSMPAGGKKKPGSKELSNTAYKDGQTQLSNSIKKGIQASVTNGSFNDMNWSPMANDPDFLKPSNSSDLAMEKHKHRQKGNHEILDNCSDGGDATRSKMKGKRESDQDSFRTSKKVRNECSTEDWISDHGGSFEKTGPCSSNGLPSSLEKHQPKQSDHTSLKDAKSAGKDRKQVSSRKTKDEVQVSLDDGSVDKIMHDGRDVEKKRKMKDNPDDQNQGFLSNTGYHLQDGRTLMKEEFSENDHRREKKARVSRSEGKESGAGKGGGRTDKKGSHRKNKQIGKDLGSTVSLRSLDGVDSLKRGSGSLHSSVAATSSSSKVSGSHKSKGNFHDAKGSPVESVSSSPMRISKPDLLTSSRRNFTNKDDSTDGGFAQGGLRRCSDCDGDAVRDRSGQSRTARKEENLNVGQHGSLESFVLDFQEKDFTHVSGGKTKAQTVRSSDITDHHFTNGGSNYLGQDTCYPGKSVSLDQHHDDEKPNENHYQVTGSCPRKSERGFSSRSKDKNRKSDSTKVNVSDYINEQAPLYEVCGTDSKDKNEEKAVVKSVESEHKHVGKKDPGGLILSESRKIESRSNSGGHGSPDVKVDASGSHDTASSQKHDGNTVSGREKSQSLLPPEGAQNDIVTHGNQPVSTTIRGNEANIPAANASIGDNTSKASKQIRKGDHPNGIHHGSSRSLSSNGHTVRDHDASSPAKRDSSSQAANSAVKEAKSLKHLADRFKHSGSNAESTKLYFEAALKFLHGASLLETCSSENARTGEMVQSMQIYSSTAKLCEFCAHEYEKLKDMGAAALAYKCMEVAYMRVIYSSHTYANRDRHELQMALQMGPPGESPSSSASDIDNLNHPTTMDKPSLTKGAGSPQVTGSHVIAARNRPNFVRLLNFAQDVNFAMEASRKSRAAFAAANVSLRESQNTVGMSSIKTALDFNFQDVEGLLRLVRLAIEAINR